MLNMRRLDLGKIIAVITFVNVCLALIVVIYATRQNEKTVFTQTAIEYSLAYSQKLASIIEAHINTAQKRLKYSAQVLSKDFDDPELLYTEGHRLFYQSSEFNSIFIVNNQGIIKEAFPEDREFFKQKKHTTLGAEESLKARKPIITKTHMGMLGNLMFSISEPIINTEGEYLGYINGSIYIKKENLLSKLLNEHFYSRDSIISTLSNDGGILQSTNFNEVGGTIKNPKTLQMLSQGKTGGFELIDDQGETWICSLYFINSTGWGILIQTPASTTIDKLNYLLRLLLLKIFPFVILGMFTIYLSSIFISRPLWQLARYTQVLNPNSINGIKKINTWYFEASQLKLAIMKSLKSANQHISSLKHNVVTDHLTGLLNRRGMEASIEKLSTESKNFSAIAIDIDHFKQVNDTYGHDMGDQVLKQVAQQMRSLSRSSDILCRQGGEEFLMIAPETELHSARLLAERLRMHIHLSVTASDRPITVSIGVAEYKPKEGISIEEVFLQADQALYKAKQQGRNRTIVYSSSDTDEQ